MGHSSKLGHWTPHTCCQSSHPLRESIVCPCRDFRVRAATTKRQGYINTPNKNKPASETTSTSLPRPKGGRKEVSESILRGIWDVDLEIHWKDDCFKGYSGRLASSHAWTVRRGGLPKHWTHLQNQKEFRFALNSAECHGYKRYRLRHTPRNQQSQLNSGLSFTSKNSKH